MLLYKTTILITATASRQAREEGGGSPLLPSLSVVCQDASRFLFKVWLHNSPPLFCQRKASPHTHGHQGAPLSPPATAPILLSSSST